MRDNPEPTIGVMDDDDSFLMGGRDLPFSAQEVDGRGRAYPAWQMQCEMKVKQGFDRSWFEHRALFFERLFPSLVRRQTGGSMMVRFVVMLDFLLQKEIGLVVVLDLLKGKQTY